jgi:class 3 adenylate cyclase
MPRLQRRSFATPDEVRPFPHGRIEVVNLDETAMARLIYQPGWRWSTDVAPVIGGTSCQNRHVGYVISGLLHVMLEDGTELELRPNDAYEIPPGHDAWVVGDEAWEVIEFASARTYGARPDAATERTLATILFTDIVDSTATVERIGDTAWRTLLLDHNDQMRAQLDRFRGREITTTGDGFVAVFDGPARGVRGAAAMRTAALGLGLTIRAGLHTGEVELVSGNARGIAVHAAARVAALAGPGEIIVSSTTHDLLEGSGLVFVDRGRHVLKGLDGERQMYLLDDPGPA